MRGSRFGFCGATTRKLNRLRRFGRHRGSVCPLYDDFDGSLPIITPEIIVVSFGCCIVWLSETGRGTNPQFRSLLNLSPRQFEEFIAEIRNRFGCEVERTKQTRDGGRDIIAVKRAEANCRFLIECKRYDPKNKVGVSIVRELYGVKIHERQPKEFLPQPHT